MNDMTMVNDNSVIVAPTSSKAQPDVKAEQMAKVSPEAVDNETIAQKISEQPLDKSQLEKVAQQLQEFVSQMNRAVRFEVDEDSGRDVLKVIDKDSGDLLKQYPSEEVLEMVARLSEATGALVNEHI